MAYTKTNLNETTETVVVDMTAEDIENDETTETVAEQNARGYSKTVWNESTPITADKLNKMETGIANAIDKTEQVMEIPITNPDGWQQFRWTRPGANTISWTRDVSRKKAFEIYDEDMYKSLLLLNDNGDLTTGGNVKPQGFLSFENLGGGGLSANIHNLALHANTGNGQMMTAAADRIYVGNPNTHLALESTTVPEVNIGGNTYFLYHTGNFNPDTKLDAGNFSINKRDLLIHGKRALVGFNTEHGDYLAINHDGDFGAGIKIYGLTRTDEIQNGGKLTFFRQMGGGQMSSLINCQELQNNTGNGQMLTASVNRIYLGNPDTQLIIESSSNPIVNVGRIEHQLFHTGNFNPNAKLDAGAFTVHDRDLRVHGKRALVGFNNPDGNNLHLNYDRDFANGVVIQGLLRTESIEATGNMKLHNGSEAVFHEICNARDVGIYLNNNNWGIYDYQKDRSVLRYNIDGDRVEVQGKRVATWDGNNPAHYMFRYGSGLGGANGYITFSY